MFILKENISTLIFPSAKVNPYLPDSAILATLFLFK
jgi:hypothetical protein